MNLRMDLKSTAIIAMFIALTPVTSPANPREKLKRLSLAQAVRLAERFVKDNGYTDLPPIKDRSRLSYESLEWARNHKELLQNRHNTLERKAYGYLSDEKGGSGWVIAFRYTGGHSRKTGAGRGVTMSPFGDSLRMEHQDLFLKFCRPLHKTTETHPKKKRLRINHDARKKTERP